MTDLADADSKAWDRLWSVLIEVGISERHFNDLIARYRALASTWLLGVFVGVGFVLSSGTLALPVSRLVVASAIALAGSLGVYLLWILDLLVYQRLLHAYFAVAFQYEVEYSWLPKFRTNMMRSQPQGSASTQLLWFYTVAVVTMLILATFLDAVWVADFGWGWVILEVFCGTVAIVTIPTYMTWKTLICDQARIPLAEPEPASADEPVATSFFSWLRASIPAKVKRQRKTNS